MDDSEVMVQDNQQAPNPLTPADKVLYSVVRIEAQHNKGTKIATGFMYTYDEKYPFLVTNRHVVENCTRADVIIPLHDGKSRLPSSPYKRGINWTTDAWTVPRDKSIDLAVMPIALIIDEIRETRGLQVVSLNKHLIPSKRVIDSLDSYEEIIFVGYPEGLYDTQTGLPIFRKGITGTPYWHDRNNKPSFLVDASVFRGSSGSPVFIYNKGMYFERGRGTTVGLRLLFLGILTIRFLEIDRSRTMAVPVAKLDDEDSERYPIDIGLVYKPKVINETCRLHMESQA